MGRYGLCSALRGVHLAGTVCPGDGGRPPGMRWRRSNGAHGFWADPRSHPFGPGTGHRGHPGKRDSLGGGTPPRWPAAPTAWNWLPRTSKRTTSTGRTASTASRRSPPGTASSGGASPVRPARTAGRPDGNEQQGLEAGFEQKAGRKGLDVFAHVDSLRVVLEGLSGFHRMAHAIKAPPAG